MSAYKLIKSKVILGVILVMTFSSLLTFDCAQSNGRRLETAGQPSTAPNSSGSETALPSSDSENKNSPPDIVQTTGAKEAPRDWTAISGETVVVGEPLKKIGSNDHQGAVYIFVRNGTNWTQQAMLTLPDGAEGDFFGDGIAISGDTLIVKGPNRKPGANNYTAVYVFVRKGSVWTQQTILTSTDGSEFIGLAIDGETLIAGKMGKKIGAKYLQGAIEVFVRTGTDWKRQATLTSADGTKPYYYNGGLDISGDTLVVGVPNRQDQGENAHGTVYIFSRKGTVWKQQAALQSPIRQATFDLFGTSVAIDGETAVVGDSWHTTGADSETGDAFVYVRKGTAWVRQNLLHQYPKNQPKGYAAASSTIFGGSVAVSGDTIIASASKTEKSEWQNQAFVYLRKGSIWQTQTTPPLITDRETAESLGGSVSGGSVAISGDTAVIHSFWNKDSQSELQVYLREGSTWTRQWTLKLPVETAEGTSVSRVELSN